jgi:PadR family transcriptional regulator PadR
MMVPMRADLLRGHLDGLLLAVLADAPGHGYELSQRLTQRSGGELGVH